MNDSPGRMPSDDVSLLIALRRRDWKVVFARISPNAITQEFLQQLGPEDKGALLVEAVRKSRADIVDAMPVESLYVSPHVVADVIRVAYAAKDGTAENERFLHCLERLVISTGVEKSGISMLLDETLPNGQFSAARAVLDCLRKDSGENAVEKILQDCLLDFARHDWPEALEGALKMGAPLDHGDHALYRTAFTGVRDPVVQEVVLKWYARDDKLHENTSDPVIREICGTLEKLRQKNGGERSALIRACGGSEKDFRRLLLDRGGASPDDFFREKDMFGNTALDLLGARGKLGFVFDPSLWSGRADEMMRLWHNHVPPVYKESFDIADVEESIAERQRRAAFKARVKKDAGKFRLK